MNKNESSTNTAARYICRVFIPLLLSNAEKNMYWSRFFEVFEEVRDKYLERFHFKVLQSLRTGSLIPSSASVKHYREIFPGQWITVVMKIKETAAGFLLSAEYSREERLATVFQELSLFDPDTRQSPLDKGKFPYFELPIFVKSGDINYLGQVHWTNYAHWLGYKREEFIARELPNIMELMEKGLVIITRETSINFIQPLHFADNVVVRIRINKVIRLNMTELHVEFVKIKDEKEELVALGLQKLAFAQVDKKGQVETTLIPTVFLKISSKYLISKTGRFVSSLFQPWS